MRSARLVVLIVVIAAFLVGGCSPLMSHSWYAMPAGSNSTAGLTSNPTPQPSSFPRGRFRAVTLPDLLVIVIENHGSYRVFLDNALVDSGQFVVQGPQVLVDSVKCSAGIKSKPASYLWFYDEETGLDFQPMGSDPCPERRQYLSYEFEQYYLFVFQITQGRPAG